MPKKNFNDLSKEKEKLGKFIRKLREEKGISLRKLVEVIGLAASNLTGIESGKNAPSPEVYSKIIINLQPSKDVHHKMDVLYSTIRNSPPPDVCNIILQNDGLGDKIKLLGNKPLTTKQLSAIETFFVSLKNEQI